MVKKFTIPFASQGDANDIPDALQVDGKVSFTQGFGYDYERPYDDPQAKDIAREDMNGLFKAITSAVGELQTLGASEWSNSVSYPKGAIVYHEKDLYISQIDDNQSKPPQNWVSITSIANDSLKKAANLSDLTNKTTARSNLGLGSSATLNKTDVLGTSTSLVATQKLVNDTKINLESSKQDKLTFVGDGPEVMKTGAFGIGVEKGREIRIDNFDQKNGIYYYKDTQNEQFYKYGTAVVMNYYDGIPNALIIPSIGSSLFVYQGHQERFSKIYSDTNTSTDKSGFLRSSGNANALVESDVTNSLGNSQSLVASQALVASVNSRIKINQANLKTNGWWKCGDTGLKVAFMKVVSPKDAITEFTPPISFESVFYISAGHEGVSGVAASYPYVSANYTAGKVNVRNFYIASDLTVDILILGV